MPSPKQSAVPRQGGGFNRANSDFGEHMEERAMEQALQQKALSQQQAGSSGPVPASQSVGQTSTPKEPRPIGTVSDELKLIPKDILDETKNLLNITNWLGLNQEAKDPEEMSKRKQAHSRYEKLTADERAVAQQMYEAELKKRQAAEEETEQRKQLEAQRSEEYVIPSGPQKGPVGPAGSGKQKAAQKIERDRKTIRGPSGAN